MPDPLVVQLASKFRQEVLARDMASILQMSRAWLPVQQAIEEEIQTLAEEIAAKRAAGETIKRFRLVELERYKTLQSQAIAEINAYIDEISAQIGSNQAINALAGLDDATALIRAVGQTNGVELTFARLGVEAVENIVAISGAGQPLRTLLETVAPTAVEGMTELLIRNTAIGRNPRQTARLAIEKGFSQGLNQTLLVARDQQIRPYRLASIQQYRASEVVEAFQRLAAKNSRTCPACLALDGKIYQMAQLPELHPQDRCTVIPIVIGLPRPEFLTGRNWFSEQTPDVQREILGSGRYDAWQAGQFDFSQLAKTGNDPTWGPTARVASLKELVN